MKKVIQLIVKHAICNTLKGLFRYFRTQCDKNRQGDIKQRKREKEMRGREGGGCTMSSIGPLLHVTHSVSCLLHTQFAGLRNSSVSCISGRPSHVPFTHPLPHTDPCSSVSLSVSLSAFISPYPYCLSPSYIVFFWIVSLSAIHT